MSAQPKDEADVDLTLFVACYNEEANIAATLRTLVGALRRFEFRWEIIVIDDASRDRSAAVVEDFLRSHADEPIRLVCNEYNHGLAQNYIEGAFLGRGKYYRLVCGDNVEPETTLIEVFRHLGKADMVLFYHLEYAGKSRFRKALSRTYTSLINGLSGHRIRYYNGLPILRRYHVMRWHTNYYGFGFQADMITRLLDQGFGYVEVPLRVTERTSGSSTALSPKNFFSVAHTMLDIGIRRIAKLMDPHRAENARRRRHPASPGSENGETVPRSSLVRRD